MRYWWGDMSLLSEYENILTQQEQIMGQIANALHGELVKVTPVDTGFLKQSWTPVERVKNGYIFSNTALYADVALHERTIVRGKMYGSEKFPQGVDPTIKYYDKLLEQELKGIK